LLGFAQNPVGDDAHIVPFTKKIIVLQSKKSAVRDPKIQLSKTYNTSRLNEKQQRLFFYMRDDVGIVPYNVIFQNTVPHCQS